MQNNNEDQSAHDNLVRRLKRSPFRDALEVVGNTGRAHVGMPYPITYLEEQLQAIGWSVDEYNEEVGRRKKNARKPKQQ